MTDPAVRCVDLVELVTDWMEGELDDATRASVEEHLVVCRPCGAYVTQMRQAVRAMLDLGVGAPPAAHDELLRLFRAAHGA